MPRPDAVDTTLQKRYVSGSCGVHITQYQKNECPGPSTAEYRLTITLKDGVGAVQGGVDQTPVADFTPLNVDSGLPAVFIATVGAVDSDPIKMAFNGQVWDSSSQCSVGGYDNGNRNMDCGFRC